MIASRIKKWQENTETLEFAQREDILQLIQASDYAGRQLLLQPAPILTLIDNDIDWEHYDFATNIAHLGTENETNLMRDLRRAKHRYQTALIHAVNCKNLSDAGFLTAISHLASALTDLAHKRCFNALITRYGTPLTTEGQPMPMTILGMGKFGGSELNFSSDIDLIFTYRHSGETHASHGQKAQDHEIFYRKLAQNIIRVLDTVTEDGFVYRVDMRLRPFGQTGPLALSYDALETYYQLHGRDWERYAMMKARPVAGDIEGGKQLLQELRPFMYRRYLDYPALTAIAEMKNSINRQIRESGMENHIKLGRGGIREAEFSVQAMQLIYGGQYPRLQNQNFLDTLNTLNELELYSDEETLQLRDAYLLLRRVENAIQYDQEQQTHQLPEHPEDWQRLALASQYPDSDTLQNALTQARTIIHNRFRRTFSQLSEPSANPKNPFTDIDWQQPDKHSLLQKLDNQHYPHSEELATALHTALLDIPWQRLTQQSQNHLETILPTLLEFTTDERYPPSATIAILALIREVIGRSVYLSLLAEQPKLLRHLLAIARDSAWLIQFIQRHPLVLDDILSERQRITDPAQLKTDLEARLENLEPEDWLNALRDFKHAQVFKIAWAEVHGNLPLMHVSDSLSLLAEHILQTAYQKAHSELSTRHGIPRDKQGNPAQFAIIAYGKLGGLELSYGSDLDLVFLYDDHRSQGSTDGEKPIANQQYFTRLVQRINNTLSLPSTSGILYETDTRLRPGGKSGMLISSIEAFEEYQQNQAWTWEHQALTRARPICGDLVLMEKFTAVKQKILSRPPKPDLREQVLAMREKMHANEPTQLKDQFNLKKSHGGLIDIEFIVQYLLLKHAHQDPILLRFSDNIRQLAALEATGYLSSFEAMTLRDNYRKLRHTAHLRYLNLESNNVSNTEWQSARNRITHIWQHVFELKNDSNTKS